MTMLPSPPSLLTFLFLIFLFSTSQISALPEATPQQHQGAQIGKEQGDHGGNEPVPGQPQTPAPSQPAAALPPGCNAAVIPRRINETDCQYLIDEIAPLFQVRGLNITHKTEHIVPAGVAPNVNVPLVRTQKSCQVKIDLADISLPEMDPFGTLWTHLRERLVQLNTDCSGGGRRTDGSDMTIALGDPVQPYSNGG